MWCVTNPNQSLVQRHLSEVWPPERSGNRWCWIEERAPRPLNPRNKRIRKNQDGGHTQNGETWRTDSWTYAFGMEPYVFWKRTRPNREISDTDIQTWPRHPELIQTSRLDAGNSVTSAQETRRKRVLPSTQYRSAEDRLCRGSSRRSKTSVFASEDHRGRPRRDEVYWLKDLKTIASGDTQIHTSTIRAVHITIPSRRNYRSAPAKPSAEFPKRSRRS